MMLLSQWSLQNLAWIYNFLPLPLFEPYITRLEQLGVTELETVHVDRQSDGLHAYVQITVAADRWIPVRSHLNWLTKHTPLRIGSIREYYDVLEVDFSSDQDYGKSAEHVRRVDYILNGGIDPNLVPLPTILQNYYQFTGQPLPDFDF